MIKTITLLKRREDLSPQAFHRYWREVHGPLVLRIPGVVGYVQARPMPIDGEAEYDGLAEVWYEDVESRDAAFETPEYRAVIDDEANFLGASTGESIFLTLSEDRLR